MANRLSYGGVIAAAVAIAGCWDSVANPIRVRIDGGAAGADAGAGPRDADVGDAADVPETRRCNSVADWPEEWVEAEQALFEAINELRTTRPRCGARDFEPPLRLAPELRCVARLHSRDLDLRDSVNVDSRTPLERVYATGARYRWVAESTVTGGTDHVQVLENLRESPEDCDHLFDPDFSAIGIGRYKEHWTLDFAGP